MFLNFSVSTDISCHFLCCIHFLLSSWFNIACGLPVCWFVISLYFSFFVFNPINWGFPNSSVGKESACNAGDPGSIPGSGRSTGEGTGYPLQYPRVSLVAQLVKNPPVMRADLGSIPGLRRSLEKGKATHSSILTWRIPWTVKSMGSQRVECNFHFHHNNFCFIFIISFLMFFFLTYLMAF